MTGRDRLRSRLEGPAPLKLMAHAVCGYPDAETSLRVFLALAEGGADIIEAQLPFSDPTADGPLIVEANHAALRAGATTERCFELLARLRRETELPILVMSYLNPLFAFGIDRAAALMARTGLDGLIVPDYPDDEPELRLEEVCYSAGLAAVPLVAPSTSLDRAAGLAARFRSPLVYAVLRPGVTGRLTAVDDAAAERLGQLRKRTAAFVGTGFGLRIRAQLEALTGKADCAVVGSALLAAVKEAAGAGNDPAAAAGGFLRGLVG